MVYQGEKGWNLIYASKSRHCVELSDIIHKCLYMVLQITDKHIRRQIYIMSRLIIHCESVAANRNETLISLKYFLYLRCKKCLIYTGCFLILHKP